MISAPIMNVFRKASLFRWLWGGSLAWMLMLGVPQVSRASVVFTNFGTGMSYDTTGGNPVGNGFDGNNYGEADLFQPTATGTLDSLMLALSCNAGCPLSASFTVSLNNDAAGSPGTAIEKFTFGGTTLNSLGLPNTPITVSSTLRPTLSSSTSYWVEITSSLSDSITWNWNSTGAATAEAISTDGGSTWFSPSGLTPGALQVNATVPVSGIPEPSLAALAGAVVILTAFRSRRSL